MTGAITGNTNSWYRQPLVWLVIAIPASAIVMGVVMVVISFNSYDGMVVDDYDRRGLEFSRDLRLKSVAARRGLRAALTVDSGDGTISVALFAGAGDAGALPGRVRLRLMHPTRDGLDRSLVLDGNQGGVYRGSLAPLAAGNWHARLETERWRLSGRMPVPGTGPVDLEPR